MPPEKTPFSKDGRMQKVQSSKDAKHTKKRLSSVPIATEICDRMSHIRATGTKGSESVRDLLMSNNLSTKGKKDKEIILSKPLRSKANLSDDSEEYKSSAYVFVKEMNAKFCRGIGFCAIRRSNVKMKPLKFHKVLCTPIKLTALENEDSIANMSSKCHTSVKYCFCMEADLVNRILKSKDSSLNSHDVQVFLRFCLNDPSCIQDDVIPNCFVKVNNKIALLQIKDKHCGPVDITHLCNFAEGMDSEDFLRIEWMPSLKNGYCLTICVAEKLPVAGVVSRLMEYNVKDQSTTKKMVDRKFKFDKDVHCTSLKASLICPLGKTRLLSPCRGSHCTHIQCMDAYTLLKMNEKHPPAKMKCYMCDKVLGDIYVDGLFLRILSRVPQSIHEVEFRQDGSCFYEFKNYFGPATERPEATDSKECDTEIEKIQSKEITGNIKIEIDNETESDILNTMDTHLSKLSKHLGEKFKDIVNYDDIDLTSNGNNEKEQRTQQQVITNTDRRKAMIDNKANNTCDIEKVAMNAPKEEEITLISDEVEISVIDDNQFVEVLEDKKDSIKRLGKKRELTVETEMRIENMIAKMLMKVKKTTKESKREEKKMDSDLVSVNDDCQVEAVEQNNSRSTREKCKGGVENNSPCIALEVNCDERDIVEIDIDTEIIIKNENVDCTSVYKADGTLVYDDETHLTKISHFGNQVLHVSSREFDHSESIEEDKNDKVKRDLINKFDNNNECDKGRSENNDEIQISSWLGKKNQDKIGTNIDTINAETSRLRRKVKKHIPSDLREDHFEKSSFLESDKCLNYSKPKFNNNFRLTSIQTRNRKYEEILTKILAQDKEHIAHKNTTNAADKDNSQKHTIALSKNLSTGKEMTLARTKAKISNSEESHDKESLSLNPDLKLVETEEGTSYLHKGSDIEMLSRRCNRVSKEASKRKNTKDSAEVHHKRREKRQKLSIDEVKKLSPIDLRQQLLFPNYQKINKRKNIAPSTKNQMKAAESGIEGKLKKSIAGRDIKDVLRCPSIPFKSKRLQEFYERSLRK